MLRERVHQGSDSSSYWSAGFGLQGRTAVRYTQCCYWPPELSEHWKRQPECSGCLPRFLFLRWPNWTCCPRCYPDEVEERARRSVRSGVPNKRCSEWRVLRREPDCGDVDLVIFDLPYIQRSIAAAVSEHVHSCLLLFM